ncbi:MAG: GTP-binding protein [Candidatus Hodarchaeota archaeon]
MSKPTYIFKCPVAGDGAVGKTSLIVRYTQGTFTDTYKMTIGTSFAVKTVDLGNVMVKLQIWDLAGQPHFGGVRPLFYQGSTGVIYVFSVIDRASFDHLSGWLEEARKNAGNVPGILIGNKSDLSDQRMVSREEAEDFAAQTGLAYLETSAKLDENVGDAFRQIAVTIIRSKWPEWIPPGEEVAPVYPTPSEPPTPAPEVIEESAVEPEPTPITIPTEPISPPEPEPIPLPEPSDALTSEPPTPSPSSPQPTVDELTQPIEPPSNELEIPPELVPSELEESVTPEPIPTIASSAEQEPPSEVEPVAEDIVITSRTESALVEFVGVNVHALHDEDFKKRALHAMQRLGVSESGIFGTFLQGLMLQGQRDVVIQSLESLQEER